MGLENNDTDVGENQIEVHVRDGKHAGPDGFDDRKSSIFNITTLETRLIAPINTNKTNPIGSSNEDAVAWYNKGLALYNQSKYDEALQALDKAIELKPDYADAWLFEGMALSSLDRYNVAALQAIDKAIELNPNDASGWFVKGVALSNQSKYGEAIQADDKAIELKPDFAEAWDGKGLALYNQGKYDEALQALDKAIELKPDDAVAWYNKGLALYAQNKYDEALQALDKAIELKPDYARSLDRKRHGPRHEG